MPNLSALASAGYTHLLAYSVEYTKGSREGSTGYRDLPTTSEETARDFVESINRLHGRGKLPYRITGFSLVALGGKR
jgi:hypothetical protein